MAADYSKWSTRCLARELAKPFPNTNHVGRWTWKQWVLPIWFRSIAENGSHHLGEMMQLEWDNNESFRHWASPQFEAMFKELIRRQRS